MGLIPISNEQPALNGLLFDYAKGDMTMNWKRKLTSRKLWLAAAAFASLLMAAMGLTEHEAAQTAAIIMAGASAVAYIIGEGLADAAGTGYTVPGSCPMPAPDEQEYTDTRPDVVNAMIKQALPDDLAENKAEDPEGADAAPEADEPDDAARWIRDHA